MTTPLATTPPLPPLPPEDPFSAPPPDCFAGRLTRDEVELLRALADTGNALRRVMMALLKLCATLAAIAGALLACSAVIDKLWK